MDLDEWELLPSHGFIDLHESGGNSTNNHVDSPSSNPNSLIDMDYFQKLIDPPPQNNRNSRVLPVVPVSFDREIGEIPVEVKEIKVDRSSKVVGGVVSESEGCDQETISQVFFKKLKEKNEFADIKMDSPKSINKGFLPQVDVATYQFEDDDEESEEEAVKKDQNSKVTEDDEVDWEDNNGGLNVWKWAMNGFGALFSFGFAAATVSLIVLGNRNKDKHSLKKTQDLHFQLYTHDKRMKQVVHHATKLNEVINAVRGAPMTRAHITIGGYYEGL